MKTSKEKNSSPQKTKVSLAAANENFRTILRESFLERKKKNSQYSLRAFAYQLDLDQSFLSKVLREQKNLSFELMESTALKLGLSPEQITKVKFGHLPAEYSIIEEDQFRLISDWAHFAILELAKTKSFKPTIAYISARLGIHTEEAKACVSRLEKYGFIQVLDNKWKLLSPNNTWAQNTSTSSARKNLQKQFAEKSLAALDQFDFAERDHSSLTVAVSKKRMNEFREKLKELRKEFNDFTMKTENEDPFDEVYQLTIAFFPITKK